MFFIYPLMVRVCSLADKKKSWGFRPSEFKENFEVQDVIFSNLKCIELRIPYFLSFPVHRIPKILRQLPCPFNRPLLYPFYLYCSETAAYFFENDNRVNIFSKTGNIFLSESTHCCLKDPVDSCYFY